MLQSWDNIVSSPEQAVFWKSGLYHEVVKVVPRQLGLDDHRCGNERREQRADRVARMHYALDGICVVHRADPRAEAGVGKAVPEAGDGISDDEDWKWWMRGEHSVGDDVADGRHNRNSPLAEFTVDHGIGAGSDRVASKRGQKDERDDGVVETIVFF